MAQCPRSLGPLRSRGPMLRWAGTEGLALMMLVRSASAPTCGEGTVLVPGADTCTSSCPPQETTSGRVYIAGVFDLTDDGGYTEEIKHHFQVTLHLLNDHSDGMWDDVLRDAVIEHTVADARCDENLAAQAYWRMRQWGRPLHGVIGCRCSGASKAVQRIAQLEQVPQISMSSTSWELSNYPYFYRTVASEGTGGGLGALVNLFRTFGWTRIGVLYTETTWARDTAGHFAAFWTGEHPPQDERDAWTGDIAYSYPISLTLNGSVSMESVRQAFAEIPVDDPAVNSKIILLLCHVEHTWPIFQYAAESGFQKDTVFVGLGSWPGNQVPASALSALNTSAAPGFLGIQDFENTGSPVYESYKQRLNQYEAAQGRSVSERLSFYGGQTVDATVALAMALSSLPISQRRNGTAVDAAILGVNFAGVSGTVQFDEQGDRKDPLYSVWNLGPWNPATESFEWRIVGSVGPGASQADVDNSSICWAGLGCGAVPPSDKYPPRLGCLSGADCVDSDEGPFCDTSTQRCVDKVERTDMCGYRSDEGHVSLFEPINVACEPVTKSWGDNDGAEYSCKVVNDTETDLNGPKHRVASICAQFSPDVLVGNLGSASVPMCCSAEDDRLTRWVDARLRQFDIQFGQCNNCLYMARKLVCQVACDQGNYRFYTGGSGVAKHTMDVSEVRPEEHVICPSFCKDLHLACSSVVWSDKVSHLYKESERFCLEVLDLRVAAAEQWTRGVHEISDVKRICTEDSAAETVHCVSPSSHRAIGFVATLFCTFTIASAIFSDKVHINFIPPASVLLCIGFLLGMLIKDVIAPIESYLYPGRHAYMDMVQFNTDIFGFLLLPVIIFCSSFNMEHHATVFFHLHIKKILFFAVLGTMIAISFTGVGIFLVNKYAVADGMLEYELSFAEAMMFGSLISAVDPVATLAAFASIGVDPRVYSIIYGESILNDAVAVVFFAVFQQVSETNETRDGEVIIDVIVQLALMSIGSFSCGIIWGALVSLLFKHYGDKPPRSDNKMQKMHEDNAAGTVADVVGDALEANKRQEAEVHGAAVKIQSVFRGRKVRTMLPQKKMHKKTSKSPKKGASPSTGRGTRSRGSDIGKENAHTGQQEEMPAPPKADATNPPTDPTPATAEFSNPLDAFELETDVTKSNVTVPDETSEADAEHRKHRAMADAAIFFLASSSAYYVAEAVHLSGIISALFCGLVCNQFAVRNITFEAREYARSMYVVLSELCDHLLMLWVGLLYYFSIDKFPFTFSLIALVLVVLSRALSVFTCGAATRCCFGSQIKIETQLMMFAAGLRGAVALALVMQMPTSSAEEITSATLFIIFWTNVVLGGLTTPLVSYLKIPNERDKTLNVSHFKFTFNEIQFLMRIDELSDKVAQYLLVHGKNNAGLDFDDQKAAGRQANTWQTKLRNVIGYKGSSGAITFFTGPLQKKGTGALSSNAWTTRLFEVGKNELRYRAGASKGFQWVKYDMSLGKIEIGEDNTPDRDLLTLVIGDREVPLRAESRAVAIEWATAITMHTEADVTAN